MKGVYDHFRDGILVIDDARLYAKYKLADEMIDIITMKRHMRVDVFFLYHGLRVVPVQCYDYVDNIIIGGTVTSIVKEKKLDVPEPLVAANRRVMQRIAAGDKYYKECINRQDWAAFI